MTPLKTEYLTELETCSEHVAFAIIQRLTERYPHIAVPAVTAGQLQKIADLNKELARTQMTLMTTMAVYTAKRQTPEVKDIFVNQLRQEFVDKARPPCCNAEREFALEMFMPVIQELAKEMAEKQR